MRPTRYDGNSLAISPAMALLLIGSLLALLSLLTLAALIGLTTWIAASSGAGRWQQSPPFPSPPVVAGRDPWTPVVSGIRYLAAARRGNSILAKIYEVRS